MMAEEEIDVQVRAVTGESIKVPTSANKTINDLKLLVTRRFPTVSSFRSPILHVLGAKLSLQTQIRTLSIEHGEFLVLIRFLKKDRPKTLKQPDFSTNVSKQSPISSFADSAYSDMMQELSSLVEKSSDTGRQHNYEPNNTFLRYKQKRDFDNYNENHKEEVGPYGFLWSVMQSRNTNVFGEQNCEKFVEVVESVNCLIHPHSRTYALFGSWGNSDLGVRTDNAVLCMCLTWLKRLLEAFAFLNIFSTFLQLHGEEVTSASLKKALKQLGRFGFIAGFEDIKHLSILCPKETINCKLWKWFNISDRALDQKDRCSM